MQLASSSEVAISGIPNCMLVVRVAAAVIGGRPYAVAALAAGGPEDDAEGGPQVTQVSIHTSNNLAHSLAHLFCYLARRRKSEKEKEADSTRNERQNRSCNMLLTHACN